jgi:hypothetical protein
MVEFTEREKRLIYGAVKAQRHVDDEHYDLYEKVGEWYFNDE